MRVAFLGLPREIVGMGLIFGSCLATFSGAMICTRRIFEFVFLLRFAGNHAIALSTTVVGRGCFVLGSHCQVLIWPIRTGSLEPDLAL